MSSYERRRERRPARQRPRLTPKRRLLVACEGTRTEPEYIKGFERHVRNATVEVEIADKQGDPKRVVEIAKERNRQARADAKRERDDFLRFDEVWCVFDRDDHKRFHDACSMAKDNRFELAISNPCIELWLLLHFRESPGTQTRHKVQKMLGKFLIGYDKGLNFDDVVSGVGDATLRATRLDADAEAEGDAGRNPTTGFYRLTESIARADNESVLR